jgi:hypothetical protein
MLCRSRSIRALRLFGAEEEGVVEENVAEEESVAEEKDVAEEESVAEERGVTEEEGVAEEESVDSCEGDAIIRISGGVLVLRTVEF